MLMLAPCHAVAGHFWHDDDVGLDPRAAPSDPTGGVGENSDGGGSASAGSGNAAGDEYEGGSSHAHGGSATSVQVSSITSHNVVIFFTDRCGGRRGRRSCRHIHEGGGAAVFPESAVAAATSQPRLVDEFGSGGQGGGTGGGERQRGSGSRRRSRSGHQSCGC